MRIYVPTRLGLGDMLAGYFCRINYGRPNQRAGLLARLRNACLFGGCESAFVLSRYDVWNHLDFPIRLRSKSEFDVPLPFNGWHRTELGDHINLLQPPQELFLFPSDPPVQLPIRRPSPPIPERFILFTDGASAEDRALDDPRIVDWLQSYLPVVRIGTSDSRCTLPMGKAGATSAALDLTNRTDLAEVFWLAKHAQIIVSPCTYLRTMSSLLGTPVLELLQRQRAMPVTITRTFNEYRGFEYGMTPGKRNFWSFWDVAPTVEAQCWLERVLSKS